MNKKRIIMVVCIFLITVLSISTYTLFNIKDQKEVANPKEVEGLAVLVDGEKEDTFPAKDSGKVFEKIECTNGGEAEWNVDTWKLAVRHITRSTECTISFITNNGGNVTLSKAEAPDLNNGMIPVVYDQEKGWLKADTSTKWYDYDAQWWANAVTVSVATREKYTNASSNIPISMDDIETMWVWIPRYEYQHTNLGASYANGSQTEPGAITINFISKDTVTKSSDNFTVHDAFWWDENNDGVKDTGEQLAGIWVAKFEMSTGATSCEPAYYSVETDCDLATIHPHVKPNVTSWRGARIGTFWTVIDNNLNKTNNTYGLTNTDAHLMKNMEWGAVAYLSQSKYGKYGNSNYIGEDKEVAVNNCSNFITGIGGDTVNESSSNTTCTANTYETTKGQAASTTGNIYGVYDMRGGVNDYVMGIMKAYGTNEPAIGYDSSRNSGWSGKLYDGTSYTGTYNRLGDDAKTLDVVEGIGRKYYDLYNYSTDYSDTSRGHLGDATKETAGWYSDVAQFVKLYSILFCRGGHEGVGTGGGLFGFFAIDGSASPYFGGRPVAVHAS